MKFILQLAKREARSSWRRLAFFFICIALGVGSIIALRSFIRNFNQVMTADARAILGADIQIDSNRPWTPEVLEKIQRIAGPFTEKRIETIESATMLRPADPSKEVAMLVELKGIESGYPFYGEFQLADGVPFHSQLVEQHGAIVARAVLERLGIKKGDRIKIGDKEFQVREVIEREPGLGGRFRFGPRVFIARQDLESAGLTGFGSRAQRRILLKTPESKVENLVKNLRKELKGDFARVRSYKDSEERLNRQFTRAENFLSMTGLIILVLGGIGVSSVTRIFIEQKRKSIAVLKCLGATGRKIIAAYLTQILLLGLAGSFAGVALAKTGIYFVSIYYAMHLPPNMIYSLHWGATLQGFAFGLLVTMLFAILPLLRIRHIKPNVLLREETSPNTRTVRVDWLRWVVAASVTAGLILLSSWQAGSLLVGVFFLSGLLAAAGLLRLSAALLIRIVKRTRKFAAFPLRHAISSLHRPGNQTGMILMAVGLGCFFIITTHSIRTNLLSEMDFERRANLPNMYLIDIQSDQKEGVRKLMNEVTKETPILVPTVRARIAAINGKLLDPESAEYKKDRSRLGFEYTITYRSNLEETEKVIAGKFWNQQPSSSPEISIDESLKGMMGLDVGGTITFDVLGRKITARVSSIRQVDWKNSRTAFYVLFRPGVLEKAPNVYIAALDAPTAEPARSRFQKKLVDQFPNVTAIDVADIVRGVRRILNTITLAVSFIGGFVFLSGVLILIGSIAMTKFQRIYEAAVMKTLGAKRKLLVSILLIEYGLLGTVAGFIGSLASIPLSYLVSKHVFEMPWHWTPVVYLIGIVVTVFLVMLVGTFSNVDVLQRKPLSILRTQ